MRVLELRTCTLASREDLDFHKDVIFPRHLAGFEKHSIALAESARALSALVPTAPMDCLRPQLSAHCGEFPRAG